MWDETQAKRGSAEISTCLYKFNSSVGAIDEMIYYSDSCTGQQRNAGFSMMCLYSVNTLPIKRITHNYFERGHSQMEGDSVHAMIEKSTKHLTIYSPDGWRQAVSMAKRTKPVYDVLKVNNTDVLDFMTFSKGNMPNRTIAGDGSKVEWTKIIRSNIE